MVCQTSPFTVTGYPRVATAQAAFSFRGTEPILLETGVEASVDEGASWQPIGAITATSNAGNHWLSMSPAASRRSTTPAPS